MMLKTVAFLSAVSAASAGGVRSVPTSDIKASSKLGGRILSQARQLDGDNFSWIAGYSLKFEKCATSDEYYGGMYGGEENGGGNQQGGYMGMYKQRLVHFKLCPSGDSGSCSNGADYVIAMPLFVEAYIESKMDAQAYNCEMVAEDCYCENANDDEACERQCYMDAGLDYCEEEQENQNGQQQFRLEEATECRELDVDEDAVSYYYYQQNQNGNGGNDAQYYQGQQNGGQEMRLFVGPYCSADGSKILLGTFMDEMCSYTAPAGAYEKFNYGAELPYSSESLIESSFVSCKEPQDANDQNNGDQQDEDEVLEICERLYEDAGKCESGLADGVTYYPNTYGCDFIKTLQKPGKMNGASSSSTSASKVFAGLFAATTIVLGGVAYYLFQKSKRANVELNSEDGALA